MVAKTNRLRSALLASTSVLVVGGSLAAAGQSLPTQGVVTSGAATIGQSGANMSVTQTSQRAIVNWNSFSIGQGNAVTFVQPGASSATLNRVTGAATSTIAGQLNANGQVFLVNPNGIAITSTGAVKIGGGFVASTLGIADDDFNKGQLGFVGSGASAGVNNAGTISVGSGGFVGLIGGTVSDSGTITVPLGKVGLGSGEQATLNPTGDNFLQVALPTDAKTADGQSLVDVSGKVRVPGGSVQLKAATVAKAIRDAVNVSGELSASSAHMSGGALILDGGAGGGVKVSGTLDASGASRGGSVKVAGRDVALKQAKIRANSASGKGGTVIATATNSVSLAATSVDASGATGGAIRVGGNFHGASDVTSAQTTTIDSTSLLNANATGSGQGGTVAVWSDAFTSFAGQITATGGSLGGDGGSAEVSSNPATHGVLGFSGFADLTASHGATGTLLLDPYDIVISTAADTGGTFAGGTYMPTATSVINTGTLQTQLGTANVVVSTGLSGSPGGDAGDLTVANAITWGTANSLTLTAFNKLNVNATISSTGAGALILNGGASVNIAATVSTGVGGVTVTGPTFLGANVTTANGAIQFNSAVNLQTNVTIGAGSASVDFSSTVDSETGFPNRNLTVTAGFIDAIGSIGATNPLGAVSLSSGGSVYLPSIAAAGDITITGAAQMNGDISSSGGSVTFNNAVTLEKSVTIDAPAGTVAFDSTVDADPSECAGGSCDLTVSASTITLVGDVGESGFTAPLGAVSLTSANSLTLPSISAFSIIAEAIGAAADVTLGSGTVLTSSGFGSGAVTLGAGNAFINNSGNGAATINFTDLEGAPTWLIYSLKPSIDTFGGLDSGNTALWNTALGAAGTQTANRYAFAFQPTITFTASDLTKTYGVDDTGAVAGDTVTPSGLQPADPTGAYLGDTNATAYSGAPATASAGSGATAAVGGYPIVVSPGTLAALNGYALAYVSGALTVNPAPLTITASNQSKTYGTAFSLGTTAFTDAGLLNGDTVASVTLTSPGAAATATVAGGPYAITPSAAVGTGLTNYAITYVNAPVGLTVNPAPLTITASDQSKTYGTAFSLGTTAFTDAGLFNGDTVAGVTLTSAGAAATATVAGGPYAITPSAAVGTGLGNYTIAYANAPGGLTVSPAALTITALDQSKTYGTALGLGTTAFTDAGLFNGDTVTGVTLTSAGATATASVATYAITPSAAVGTGLANYAVTYQPGALTVSPLALTYAVANANSTYGTLATLGAATLTGVLTGDVVDATVGAFSGASQVGLTAKTPVGAYSELVTGLSNANYTIAAAGNTPGVLTISPLALTYAVANANGTFGTTATLGKATLTGVVLGDTVDATVGAFSGGAPVALSPTTPQGVYDELVTALSNPNYAIAAVGNTPGILTIGKPAVVGQNPAVYADTGPISNASVEVWPPFVNSCSAGPNLPNPNHYSDPLVALEAMSKAMAAFCERCNDPTQSNIADALEQFAQELAVLAPRLPPQLRNLPTIVHEAAVKVRAARSVGEAVAALSTAINQVNHDIALLRVADPDAAAANAGLGRLVNATLQASEQRLIRVSGL